MFVNEVRHVVTHVLSRKTRVMFDVPLLIVGSENPLVLCMPSDILHPWVFFVMFAISSRIFGFGGFQWSSTCHHKLNMSCDACVLCSELPSERHSDAMRRHHWGWSSPLRLSSSWRGDACAFANMPLHTASIDQHSQRREVRRSVHQVRPE